MIDCTAALPVKQNEHQEVKVQNKLKLIIK